MKNSYIIINYWQLALSSLLIAINIGLSIRLKLGLEKSLMIASVRMAVQLLLIGFVLEWLFAQDNVLTIILISLMMTGVAGIAAVNQTKRRFAGIYLNSLISVFASSSIIVGLGMAGIIKVQPWYDPQYLIPMLGMVLGNTLNGISLSLDRFMEGLIGQREQIETLLALGATRLEATQRQVSEACRVGMIPTINSMMIMGLVSLPGMMTGQILAGANPIDAVRYQIVIMFMIAAATALGIFGVVLLAFYRLSSPDHQLRLDHLDKL